METIKYGMIGTGQMAVGHLGCIENIDDIEIVAAADTCEKSLNNFQSKNKDEKTQYFSDYKELLELDEIDAVVVATPDNTHVDIVLDVLNAGKHVLSEKPAATSLKDFERLEQAVDATDKIYQVGLECRYLPVFQRMRKLIEDNALGQPHLIWCKEFRGPFLEKVGNWIMFNDKTGGVFVEKTCHYFDLMTWFANSTPKKVVAMAGLDVVKDIYGVKPDVFDNGWAMIEYENGARAMLGLCMFCKCENDIEMGVIGDSGKMEGFFIEQKIEFSEFDSSTTITYNPRGDSKVEKLSHGGGVYYEHLAFINNVRNNLVPLTDINVAKWSTYVGLAAEESARNGSTPVNF